MASSKPDIGAFARDLIVKAFDTLANRVESSGTDTMPGLQKLADSWHDLNDAEREELASRVTKAAQLAAAALPVAFAAAKKRVRRRVKRTTTAAAAQVATDVKAIAKKDEKKA
ncbi:MAG: hypothetical protein ACXVH7_13945, partial [Thermoanaerobaculia bacterium]